MNNLNWTALFGFLAAVSMLSAPLSLLVVGEGGLRHKTGLVAAIVFAVSFVLFGSLTALTWGG